MMDQKSKVMLRGIECDFIGDSQCDEDRFKKIMDGCIQLLLISPESLICNDKYRQMLLSPVYKKNLVAFVVDEAHCVKNGKSISGFG